MKYNLKGCSCILFAGLLFGCSSSSSNQLKEYGISDVSSCDNIEAIKQNANESLVKDKGSVYCALTKDLAHINQANAYVAAGYDAQRINEILSITYYQNDLTERYIAYDDGIKSVEDVITSVNIGLDQPYFTNVTTITALDDITMLINKYHALPEGYVPENLVETPSPCTIGEDYSCQSEKQYLVEEVAKQLSMLQADMKAQGATLSNSKL